MNDDMNKEKGGLPGMGGKLNPLAIQSFLGGINYPASKEDIINIAKKNMAPANILEILKKIGGKMYSSPAELTREVSQKM